MRKNANFANHKCALRCALLINMLKLKQLVLIFITSPLEKKCVPTVWMPMVLFVWRLEIQR